MLYREICFGGEGGGAHLRFLWLERVKDSSQNLLGTPSSEMINLTGWERQRAGKELAALHRQGATRIVDGNFLQEKKKKPPTDVTVCIAEIPGCVVVFTHGSRSERVAAAAAAARAVNGCSPKQRGEGGGYKGRGDVCLYTCISIYAPTHMQTHVLSTYTHTLRFAIYPHPAQSTLLGFPPASKGLSTDILNKTEAQTTHELSCPGSY